VCSSDLEESSDWHSNWTRTELEEVIVDYCWTYGKAA
jgi:hypothetical protein